MFTGLIREVGKAGWLRRTEKAVQLMVHAPRTAQRARTGESVAVNGCCLTVSACRYKQLMFDLLGESLDRTNLGDLKPGSPVNLERALRIDGRLGGHFVQGHVDCAAKVLSITAKGQDVRLEVELPPEFARYASFKGSIAVNGTSLTVAELNPESFAVWIIPHTWQNTNLSDLRGGDRVNLEFDVLAKYVERLLEGRPAEAGYGQDSEATISN